MAGHSHWAKIKRAKASSDAKKGQIWSKLARKIIVAARTGGGNPADNLQLRYAIEEARAANMPKDTIENAIKKGIGEVGSTNHEHIIYEGYGPGGVAIMVECLTDNRNRTAPELRKIFERAGGQLGSTNCVAWMFTQKGIFTVPADAISEDELIEICLDAGADDVRKEGDVYEITSQVSDFTKVKDVLTEKGIELIQAEITMVPNNTVSLAPDKARQVISLVETLEDHDDVQKVFSNLDIPDEVAAELEKPAQ
ncbi:MAG: YebC/PmpR family DNA-binding transcriptional regulator [Planctomycetes bacterium]|nr:YebC/PmpR family DNA-binding transcriptional regulator [Planctomycetota bacterium]